MVFGVFDGLDMGHRFFLTQAKNQGDNLVIVLAPDAQVGVLKQKSPRFSFNERKIALEKSEFPDATIEGDKKLESWNCFDAVSPDVIVLGYDQDALKVSLGNFFQGKKSPILVSIEKQPDEER